MNLVAYFLPYVKTNSKWLIAVNLATKIIKFLEDNIGEYINDFGVDKSSSILGWEYH